MALSLLPVRDRDSQSNFRSLTEEADRLRSSNSAGLTPTAPAKGQLWFDTTANALKFFNNSYTATTLGTGSGTVTSLTSGTGITLSPSTITTTGSISIDTAWPGQTAITTLGTIATGTWSATTIAVNKGGTGATTLTGILKGNGTSAFTAVTAPSGALVGDTDTQTLSGKTLTSPLLQGQLDGWIAANETWTYASATTFTIAGVDRTSTLNVGDKIKLTQTTTKYFYIVATSFSTNTTVTVTGGTDYTLANAAITLPNYSKDESPNGFPDFFAYTGTTTAGVGTITTATNTWEFSIKGRTLFFNAEIAITVNGTGAGSVRSTIPVTAISSSRSVLYGRERVITGKSLNGAFFSTTGIQILFYDNTYPGGTVANVLSFNGQYRI